MQQIMYFLDNNLTSLHMPRIDIPDVVEILIITFLTYHILLWAKKTRIWPLFKGVLFILIFVILANYFNMTTIVWIARNVFQVAVIAIVIVLQPELRKALEQLGRKNFISSLFPLDAMRSVQGLFSDKTLNEITRACVEMAKVRTGALIVIEQNNPLSDYEKTGIDVDAVVSSQLLINIFEHNTPLHDGAVIVRGDRIVSATCYLPLSDSLELSKDLGTRHRAGVGISEVTDSMTLIVSEETGKISVAYGGELESGLDADRLKDRLKEIQNKPAEEHKRKNITTIPWKGKAKE